MSDKLREAIRDLELCAVMSELADQLDAHGIDSGDRGVVTGLVRGALDRAFELGRQRGTRATLERVARVEP